MRQYGRQLRLEMTGDGETIVIENLRVRFEIEKSINEKPNPAVFSIYNLNRDHLNALVSLKYKRVTLWVGYGELRVIFKGNIKRVSVKREDVDFVAEIEAGDGLNDYKLAKTSMTLRPGATDETIIKEALKGFKEVKTGALCIPNKRVLPRGKVLHGDSRRILRKIAVNNQADWSVQDEELIFLPFDYVLNDEVVFLSQDTGLVGSPEQTDDGLELTCLLNPLLKIGGLVRLSSILPFFNGDYKITKLTHTGDNMDGEWVTKLSVVGGKFTKVNKATKSNEKKKGGYFDGQF